MIIATTLVDYRCLRFITTLESNKVTSGKQRIGKLFGFNADLIILKRIPYEPKIVLSFIYCVNIRNVIFYPLIKLLFNNLE